MTTDSPSLSASDPKEMFAIKSGIVHAMVLLTLMSTFVPSPAHASYLQFCRFDGEIVSHPRESDCCVEFEIRVAAAEAYEDPVFGEGWDGCDEFIGQNLSVNLVSADIGDRQYSSGQTTSVWRYAIELEVNGEMSSVVGFSAVDPTAEHADD